MKRQHTIAVRLSDNELAELDEMRPDGMPRAVFMRRLVHGPPREPEVATRAESMSILSSLAREGRTQAAIALARELRESGERDVMDWILDAD